ncbi:thioredoxin [Mycena olivaceomarginata]|nr:thioredoxin [Mycena olivaceomarginata]
MPVTPIQNLDEFHKVINSPTPLIIEFWAEWCGPCKTFAPVFAKHSDQPENAKLQFYRVDMDLIEGFSAETGVLVLPTFSVFLNGDKIDEMMQTNSKVLAHMIAKFV